MLDIEEVEDLQITEEDRRVAAKHAMKMLAAAMGLQDMRGGIQLPGRATKETVDKREHLYWQLGLSILGEECPAYEQLT